jgi:hypothetical protein
MKLTVKSRLMGKFGLKRIFIRLNANKPTNVEE